MSLEDWGWDERWAKDFAVDAAKGLLPARVIEQQRGLVRVATADAERPARVLGALRHQAKGAADLPAVGDWIAAEPVPGEKTLVIRRILARRSKLSRKAAGEALEEQVIAANLDAALVMTAFNADFNPRRLERFLAVVRESGAEPVLVINKSDACDDPVPYLAQAEAVAGAAAVVSISAKSGAGVERLEKWIRAGRTVGCLGSSGVGKSTLVNRLLGAETLRTAATRASDERGRHTTTHRELFVLPGGGILLDTPGMREMQFWDAERGVAETFDEIDALAASCRFSDCRHDTEPGCAVKAAVDSGAVSAARLESWRKLKRELDAKLRREDPAARAAEKRKVRMLNKALKKHPKAGR